MQNNNPVESKDFMPPAAIRHYAAEAANLVEHYFQVKLALSTEANRPVQPGNLYAQEMSSYGKKPPQHVFLVQDLRKIVPIMKAIEDKEQEHPGEFGERTRGNLNRIRQSLSNAYIVLKSISNHDTQRLEPHVLESDSPTFSKEKLESICNGLEGALVSVGHAAAIKRDGAFQEPSRQLTPQYTAVLTGVLQNLAKANGTAATFLKNEYSGLRFFGAGVNAARQEIQGEAAQRINQTDNNAGLQGL